MQALQHFDFVLKAARTESNAAVSGLNDARTEVTPRDRGQTDNGIVTRGHAHPAAATAPADPIKINAPRLLSLELTLKVKLVDYTRIIEVGKKMILFFRIATPD